MLYRKLGKTDLTVSILGFGAMRLPVEGGTPETGAEHFNPTRAIDEKETGRMVDYAVSHGINYFDTAYFYHGGKSEVVLGKALKPYREKVIIATKLPAMMARERADFERFLTEQLTKLLTGYIDVYLLHGLNRGTWTMVKEMGVLSFLDRMKSEGRIRHAAFSFHDDLMVFKEIVDSYDWDLCQIQYNYYDEHHQAGTEGLEYAASKGLGVVVMEPIRGGRLASPVPAEVQAIWEAAEVKRTPAEWALRWVWNHSEVSLALSGMNTMEQVIENVRIAEDARADSLTPKELSLIDKVCQTYRKMVKVDCTGCAYCMPCETGVNIPMIFSLYNDYAVFADKEMYPILYKGMLMPEQRADACIECGECEAKCPQQIAIREQLKKAHEELYREDVQGPAFMARPTE